jgi:hypothetical protein
VDAELFGMSFAHLCALRAVVTMIARRMHDQGVEAGDAKGIARINREVAMVTGHGVNLKAREPSTATNSEP